MIAIPRTAWVVLPLVGIAAAGFDFWSTYGVSSIFRDVPLAVVVAMPYVALPGLMLGIALAVADLRLPKHRPVWIATEAILVIAMLVLGLWLGPQMDF